VAGGHQQAFGTVNELDFALLEFAHHRFDIARLKVGEGVIGLARSPAEDHRLCPATTANTGAGFSHSTFSPRA